MDPEDVTISTGADNDITGNPSFVPGNTTTTATLNTTDIVTALNAGTNVTVTTGGDAQAGPNGGSITVSNAISATHRHRHHHRCAHALRLQEHHHQRRHHARRGSGVTGGALTLRADNHANSSGQIKVAANITTNGGSITMGGGTGAITAGSGYAVGDRQMEMGAAASTASSWRRGREYQYYGNGNRNSERWPLTGR